MSDNPVILKAPEVAEMLRISLWSVYDLARRKEIPNFSVGRSKRFIKSEVMAWAKGLHTEKN